MRGSLRRARSPLASTSSRCNRDHSRTRHFRLHTDDAISRTLALKMNSLTVPVFPRTIVKLFRAVSKSLGTHGLEFYVRSDKAGSRC